MTRTRLHIAAVAALLILLAQSGSFAAAVKNGDFEAPYSRTLAGWSTAGQVNVENVSGVWHRVTATFNSGKEKNVGFYFYTTQGSTGSVWIDNVSCPGAVLKNSGFEETGADGGLADWSQSDRQETIFPDTARASDGKQSVRITFKNEAIPLKQIGQKFAVKPNTDYALSFDLFIDDGFQGESQGLVYDEPGNACIQLNYGATCASPFVEFRDRCDLQAVRLTNSGEGQPTEISQVVDVTTGMNLSASVDFKADSAESVGKFTVYDGKSGAVLAEAVTLANTEWQTIRLPFRSKSTKVRLRLSLGAKGSALADNVALSSPALTPPAQQVKWLPANQNFAVPSKLGVFVKGKRGKVIDGGLGVLKKDAGKLGIEVSESSSASAPLRIVIGDKLAAKGKGPESYTLQINKKGITIRAAKEAGALYGLMSVLQLLQKQDGKMVALACDIVDYPDMPMRGVLYGDVEQAVRLKMNTYMVSTGLPASPSDRADLKKQVDYWRSLNLEVIPYYITLFSGNNWFARQDLNMMVGVWVQDEKLTLRGADPTNLANHCVIRTKLTDVALKSADGATTYTLGKDYVVIDGEMVFAPDTSAAKPFAVARTADSSIQDGAEVVASYDYLSQYRASTGRADPHVSYCQLEPKVRQTVDEYMTGFAREYQPNYTNTSNCLEEFGPNEAQMATDSRIIKSGKKPIELLAEDVVATDTAMKLGYPKARTLQWAGHLNDYSRAVAPKLPKDAMINVWGYDASWPMMSGRESVEFWSKLGFVTSVMPWNNLRNVRGWAQVVAEARRKGYKCLGIIDSCWSGVPNTNGGVIETAIVSWRVPRKGEKNYVELPK